MMFNKELFLSLCEKYDVELSDTVKSPMIKDGGQIREITDDDVRRVFMPCQMDPIVLPVMNIVAMVNDQKK